VIISSYQGDKIYLEKTWLRKSVDLTAADFGVQRNNLSPLHFHFSSKNTFGTHASVFLHYCCKGSRVGNGLFAGFTYFEGVNFMSLSVVRFVTNG